MEKIFMSLKNVLNKVMICKLKITKEIMKYYDEYREKNKYNKDMIKWNYTCLNETVETFKKYTLRKDSLIFDVSCGTGWFGFKLKEFGYRNFNCANLSQKLLDTISIKLNQKLISFKESSKYIFTDGITEMKDAKGEMFGQGDFQNYIKKYQSAPNPQRLNKIIEDIIKSARIQKDDLTIVTVDA